MGEKEIMPKRMAKSRGKGHKYSFFDILIFLFACLISIGAIYYFFIIDKYQEPGLEPTKHTKSKQELKSKSSKIDSATKDKDVNPKSSNGTKILNPKKDNDKKELNPKNPSTQIKIDSSIKDEPKDKVNDDSRKDDMKPKAQQALEESKKAKQSNNTEDLKNDKNYINPGPSFAGEYGIPSIDMSNGSNESEKSTNSRKMYKFLSLKMFSQKQMLIATKKKKKVVMTLILKLVRAIKAIRIRLLLIIKISMNFLSTAQSPHFLRKLSLVIFKS
jgi:hypothetical protein